MDESYQQPIGQTNYSTGKSSKSKKWLFVIIFVFLLAGLGFGISKYFFGAKDKNQKSLVITPTPTEYQFPTETPTQTTPTVVPTTSPTKKPTATPTTKPTSNPIDSATGLDRSTLKVEVQNGSGTAGVAGKGSDILKGYGYNVVATGNADNYDYQNVTIKVKSTKSNFLPLLKKDLGFDYTVGTTSADLSSDSSADALVIIGK